MNNQKYRNTIAVLMMSAALMTLAAVLPLRTFASENIPVVTDISVTYIVNGNVKKAGGDVFTLTADDPQSPMPEGSIDGKKEITIRDEGSYSFGDILYERPDVHWYTITRNIEKKKGAVKDDSVFRVKVIAQNDGNGYVLVYRDGSDEKDELVYKDRVAPDTGEDNSLMIYSIMGAAAAAALAVYAAFARKSKRKSVKH